MHGLGGGDKLFAWAEHLFPDRKSTRLNSSHTVIYTLSLHDALPISLRLATQVVQHIHQQLRDARFGRRRQTFCLGRTPVSRSEEHTSELQSHRDLHSFPTRRSSDLLAPCHAGSPAHSPTTSGCTVWEAATNFLLGPNTCF